jgi:hypothetical protein
MSGDFPAEISWKERLEGKLNTLSTGDYMTAYYE